MHLLSYESAHPVHREYCKFGNFRENFIFGKIVKCRICDIKNLGLVHDLANKSISVEDSVIFPFRKCFILAAKTNPSQKFMIL